MKKLLTLVVYYSVANSGWIIKQNKHVATFAWKGVATTIETTLAAMGIRFKHTRGRGEWRASMCTTSEVSKWTPEEFAKLCREFDAKMRRFASILTHAVPDGVTVLYSASGALGAKAVPASSSDPHDAITMGTMVPSKAPCLECLPKPGERIADAAVMALRAAHGKALAELERAQRAVDELNAAIAKLES